MPRLSNGVKARLAQNYPRNWQRKKDLDLMGTLRALDLSRVGER